MPRGTVRAEYDARTNTLRLIDTPDGLRDHQKVLVAIEESSTTLGHWRDLENSLPAEVAESLRNEMLQLRDDGD